MAATGKPKRVSVARLTNKKLAGAGPRDNTKHAAAETFSIGYDPLFAEQIYNLGLLGIPYERAIATLGFDHAMVAVWRAKFSEFDAAVKHGFDVADAMVARSLFHRAVGVKVVETKTAFDAKSGQWYEHDVIVNVPPDTQAAIYWLRNRQPEFWCRAEKYLKAQDASSNAPTITIVGGLPAIEDAADE